MRFIILQRIHNQGANMRGLLLVALCAGFFSLGLISTANATLLFRLGGLAYYDTVLDITWAADADINSLANWDDQQTWVSSLIIGGIGGWRLPSADVNGDNTVIDCTGGNVVGCSDNEIGHLFWEDGIKFSSPGVFTNIQGFGYWFGTENPLDPSEAWSYNIVNGGVNGVDKGQYFHAFAVHSGDVGASAVPAPGTIALMGLGLAGMLGYGRRPRRR